MYKPDSICKHCGARYGWHESSSEACPLGRGDGPFAGGDDFTGWASTKFEPAEEAAQEAQGATITAAEGIHPRERLRKVVFCRYPTRAEKEEYRAANGGDKMATKLEGLDGFFHCWGNSYEEFGEFGPGNYTTAIVEDLGGQCFEIIPSDVQFIS